MTCIQAPRVAARGGVAAMAVRSHAVMLCREEARRVAHEEGRGRTVRGEGAPLLAQSMVARWLRWTCTHAGGRG